MNLPEASYVFVVFEANEAIKLGFTEKRVTGILSVFNSINKAVSNFGKQIPPADAGVDEFEFWCPQRRPQGQNLAISLAKPQPVFEKSNLTNGIDRPVNQPNAWVADPTLSLIHI